MNTSDPRCFPPGALPLLRQLQPLAREARAILLHGLQPRLVRSPGGELVACQRVRLSAADEDRLGELNLLMEPLRQELWKLGVRLTDTQVSELDL